MKGVRLDKMQRSLIFERDGYRCLHCGRGGNLSVQHRINRGMGGSSSIAVHAPSNGVTICWQFNTQMESDALLAEFARDKGWKLRPGEDPTQRPVWDMADQLWYRLDNEYGRTPTWG